ncbi:MAG: RNA polymerase sigma factor [Caulobacterales bacterium]|uniref:RNA polymerase sigma factor n=1 Tax=Glycocaulis sp. TaxID=1969725 RepID=UPI003F9FF71B
MSGEASIRPVLHVISGSKRAAAPDSDAALARALARGEPAAMQGFVARTLPQITGIARRMLGDGAEAEDVAQETYLRVWRNADRWKPGAAKFDSWVMRIAVNLCYDRLRKRREAQMPEGLDRETGEAGADARLAAEDSRKSVLAAVAALPERQRLALELCHFQELGNIEAAGIMEVSVEAMESLLSRARRTLRERLSGEAGELISTLAASNRQDDGETRS